jgi:glycosyltransferase involved in cell wall biosynthesis
MSPAPSVSVAIPVFNEAEVLPSLLSRLRTILDAIPGGPHQMVFVDDGSSDTTVEVLEAEARRDSRILVVALSRNFGHQTALTAALDHVVGDVTVVMDADLQDPPEALPLFLGEHARGFDVVYARRVERKEGLLLRLSYFLFYRLIAKLSALDLPLDAGDFGLMSRRVVEELRRSPEHHRYLRGLRRWVGFRQTGVVVERSARAAGTSKYGPAKLLKLAFDGIFAFSIVPLRVASMAGALAVALSTLFAVYSLYAKFVLNESTRGFTALVLIIAFLSGLQLLVLGVMGEYLGRVYEEVKGRPLYVIDRVIGRRGRTRDPGADDEGAAVAAPSDTL